jgi:hypothetical protein
MSTQNSTAVNITGGAYNGTIGASTPAAGSFSTLTRGVVSDTEFTYLDGVTGPIQTQINGRQPLDPDLTTLSALGNWKIPYSNAVGAIVALDNGSAGQYLTWTGSAYGWGSPLVTGGAASFSSLIVGSVDNTEFGYLNGVTSNLQTQLNTKQATGAALTALTSAGMGTNGQVLTTTGAAFSWSSAGTGGVSSTGTIVDNGIALFSGTGGALIKSSGVTISGDSISTPQGATGGQVTLKEASGGGSEYRAIRAPTSLSDNVVFLLPSAAPTANQILLFGAPSSSISTLTFGSIASPLSVSGSSVTIADGAIGVAKINATGTPSSSTYLRGDGTWSTAAGDGGGVADSLANAYINWNSSSGGDMILNKPTILAPAGSDNQIQYKSGSALAAIPGLGFNATDNSLTLPGMIKWGAGSGQAAFNVMNDNAYTPADNVIEQGDTYFDNTLGHYRWYRAADTTWVSIPNSSDTQTYAFQLQAVTTASDILLWRPVRAIRITRVDCYASADNVVGVLSQCLTNNVTSCTAVDTTDWTVTNSTSGFSVNSGLDNPNIAEGAWLKWVTTSVGSSGTNNLSCTVQYNE